MLPVALKVSSPGGTQEKFGITYLERSCHEEFTTGS
jgi:hypothetical protein